MIAIDLSKQQALDADPKAIQQINFTANLNRDGNILFHYFILFQYFISFLKKQKKILTRNCKSFLNWILLNKFNSYQYKNGTTQ